MALRYKPIAPPAPKEKQNLLQTVFDLLSRGQYVSANTAKRFIDLAQNEYKGKPEEFLSSLWQGLKGGVTGEEKGDYTKILEDEFGVKGAGAKVGGFLGNLILDPLNLVSFGGLTKAGKLKGIATTAAKAGSKVDDVSKVGKFVNTLRKAGKPLDLADDIVDQVRMGDRALVQIAGKRLPVLPAKAEAAIMSAPGKAWGKIAQTPLGGAVHRMFSTKPLTEAGKEMQSIRKAVRDNPLRYQLGKVQEEGLDLSKRIQDLGKLGVDEKRIRDLVEMPNTSFIKSGQRLPSNIKPLHSKPNITSTSLSPRAYVHNVDKLVKQPQEVQNVVNDISRMLRETLEAERKVGIDTPELSSEFMEYIPRYFKNKPDKQLVGSAPRAYGLKHPSMKARKLRNITSREAVDAGFDFIENPALSTSMRRAYSEKAVANAKYLDELTKRFGKEAAEELPEGYRAIKQQSFFTPKGLRKTDPYLKKLDGKLFPEEVAREIEKEIVKAAPSELSKAVKPVLDAYDQGLSWWKAQTLPLFPSYHSRNLVGNVWQNYLNDVGIGNYVDSLKAQVGSSKLGDKLGLSKWLDKEIVTDTGQKLTLRDAMEQAKKTGALDTGFFNVDVGKSIEEGLTAPSLKQSLNPLSKNNAAIRAGRKVGSSIEDNARLANFLDKIKKGHVSEDAAAAVNKYLFDYGDLTDFEKQVMKRMFPFYTFTRKNIPLQLESLAKNPGKFATIPKAVNAIKDPNAPNQAFASDWIQENMGVPIRTADGEPAHLPLRSYLPAVQPLELANIGQLLGSMLTPAKLPLELATNKNFAFGEDIERTPGAQTNMLGLDMRNKAAHALRQLRPLSELDRTNPGNIFGALNSMLKGQGMNFKAERPHKVDAPGQDRAETYLTGLKQYKYDVQKGKSALIARSEREISNIKSEINYNRREASRLRSRGQVAAAMSYENRAKQLTEQLKQKQKELSQKMRS